MSIENLNNEPELLQRIAKGDEQAFKIVFNSYYQQLVYFAHTLTNDELQAQDAASEAFLKLWNKRTTLESSAHIRNYLFLSVKHTCLDFIRSNSVREKAQKYLLYLSEDTEEAVERAIAESEVIRDIAAQIEGLPKQCRKVFSHIFFDGMTTEEVAAKMNISTKNVLNQKGIAIKYLRSQLLKKGLLTALLYFFKNFC